MTAHTRTILTAICAVFFGVNVCMAQTNDPQTITNWGESVNGVQMSISLSNNVNGVGWRTLSVNITNSSTNIISFDDRGGLTVTLIGEPGKTYELIRPVNAYRSLTPMPPLYDLKPDKSWVKNISLPFGLGIESGEYTLKATIHFTMHIGINGKGFELVSNSLKVQVK